VSSPRHAWIAMIAGILPSCSARCGQTRPTIAAAAYGLALDLFASFAVKHDG